MSEGKILRADTYDQLRASSQEFQNLVTAHNEIADSEKHNAYGSQQRATNPNQEIQKIYTKKELGAEPGHQLIEREKRETGDTGLKPYIQYLSHNKGFLYLSLAVIFHIIFIIGQLVQSLWLAAELQNPQISSFILNLIYTVIGCIMLLFLLLRSYAVVMLGIKTSKSIFSKLMTSIFRAPMSYFDSTPLGRILSRVRISKLNLFTQSKLIFQSWFKT